MQHLATCVARKKRIFGTDPKLANEWRVKGEKGEVQRLLRRLQAIRVGTLKIADQDSKRLLTQIPPELNTLLGQLGLLPLFSQPPGWAEA